MRRNIGSLIVCTVLIVSAFGQAETAESPALVVIVDDRVGKPADDASRWEASPPVQQAVAAARSYWSGQDPEFDENLRFGGFDDEIVIEQFPQPSCDAVTWESVGEPQPLLAISGQDQPVYTEIPLGVTGTA